MNRRRALRTCCGLVVLSAVMNGCQDPATIKGKVVDNFGEPIGDAEVTVVGTTLSDRTLADGSYSVEYVPGKFSVSYSKEGYGSGRRDFEVTALATIPAEDVILFRKPEGQGAWLIDEQDYKPLHQASEIREVERLAGSGLGRRSTFRITGEATELKLKSRGVNLVLSHALISGREVILIRGHSSGLFPLQPLYKFSEQPQIVSLRRSGSVPGYSLFRADLEANEVYSLVAVGDEGCGFLTCKTLEPPAFLLQTLPETDFWQ